MKAVGIDIGSFSIKVAELSGSGSQVQIDNLHNYPRSHKPGVDKELELITMLKEITSLYKGDEVSFVLAVSQDSISTRNIFFPFKEKYKILKSLPFELEDLTPISATEGVFEGKITQTLPHGSEVLALAAPKESVKKVLDLCHDVHIDPDIISVEGFALNNLFEDIFQAPPQGASLDQDLEEEESEDSSGEPNQIEDVGSNLHHGEAILDLGYESSTLLIRSQSTVFSIRQINWGGKNLVSHVASALKIQETEAAQRIKASSGILLRKNESNEDQQRLSELMGTEVQNLGRLLKLSLLEVKGLHSIDVKGVGLLGGLASMRNIGAKLTESTLVPCNKILKIKNHPEIDLVGNKGHEMAMGTAIGLALEAFKRPSNPPINLRRDEFKKENTVLAHFWSDWGFYINLAAASIAVFFIYAFLRNSFSEDLAYKARSEMREAGAAVFKVKPYSVRESNLAQIFSKIEKREHTKEKIFDLAQKEDFALSTLRKISEKAGSRLSFPIDIQNLKILPEQVKIQGVTTNKAEVKRFADKLKPLAKGKVTNVERPSNGKTFFTITFNPKKAL